MGKAGVETIVAGDLRSVQRDDFGGELVIFWIIRALFDTDLQVKVRRFDTTEAIFAGVLKFAALVGKQAADVGVEPIRGFFDICVADFAHECLCRRVVAVRQVVALLVALEAAHAAFDHADDAALKCGRARIWSHCANGTEIGRSWFEVQYSMCVDCVRFQWWDQMKMLLRSLANGRGRCEFTQFLF